MEFLTGFILGLFAGATMFVGYGYYALSRLKKSKDAIKAVVKKKVNELDSKRESIIVRLKQAQALTEQQMNLRDATDQPSKNSLHSRYKNGLVGEIKKLEEEKVAILQSILNDGFDPVITVINDMGEREEYPLSHFVKGSQLAEPQENRKPSKFVVLKGGKDDGTTH
jgi:hypothetical protein